MKIAVDCRMLNKRIGMARVTYNLLLNLKKLDKNNEFIVDLLFDREVDNVNRKKWIKLGYNVKIIKCKNYFLWEQFFMPIYCRKNKYNCTIFMLNTGSIFIRPSKFVIGYIHDVIYMKSKKIIPYSRSLYKFVGRLYRKLIVPLFAKKTNYIITVSKFSKFDIINELKCDPKKIIVNYNGFDSFGSVNKVSNIYGNYIFALGSIDSRKNTDLVIKYFYKINKINEFNDYKLILSGIENFNETCLGKLAKKLNIRNKIISLGFVDDNQLFNLYRNAKVFLFLSSYEGFGLPLLEAMYCGVPIVSSKLTCIPEIADDAAIYVDIYNETEVVDTVVKVLSNIRLRKDIIKNGYIRVKQFTWIKSCVKLKFVLQKIENFYNKK